MKITYWILGIAFVIMTGIMIFLLKNGGALRAIGVIKPTEFGSDFDYIGKAVAVRMFPEFHAAKNVIWYLDHQDEDFTKVFQATYQHYQNPQKPPLHDLRQESELCADKCWYVQQLGNSLPQALVEKMKTESSIEIFIQDFKRDESVPPECENQKLIDYKCMRPISVREIHRKLKDPVPYFFMRRYQESQFYLYIEKR